MTTFLLVSCSTTWTMLIQTERSQQALTYRTQLRKKQEQREALAKNSITIQNNLKDVDGTTTKQSFEYLIQNITTEKTLNSLAEFHANKSTQINNKSVEELVQMINLANYLDIQEPLDNQNNTQATLQKTLLSKKQGA